MQESQNRSARKYFRDRSHVESLCGLKMLLVGMRTITRHETTYVEVNLWHLKLMRKGSQGTVPMLALSLKPLPSIADVPNRLDQMQG